MDILGFIKDRDNYNERVVGRYDNEDGTCMISTAYVSDGVKPYETAFQHPDYKDGEVLIVEAYSTKEEALRGHEKWLKIMMEGPLPDFLTEYPNAGIAQLYKVLGGDMQFKRKKTR